jgi:hypothetical protein
MIEAQRSGAWTRFFSIYGRWMLKRHFCSIRVHGGLQDDGRPVLMLANHFSWWDGFLINRANALTLKKKLFVMMLEAELEKNRILRRSGAFSVKKNTRSAVDSLKYASSLLEDHDNLLLLFPQGRFQGMNRCPLRFEKGWHRILQGNQKIRLVFAAQIVNYFASKKPVCDIWLTDAPENCLLSNEQTEKEYNIFLESCLQMTEEKYA